MMWSFFVYFLEKSSRLGNLAADYYTQELLGNTKGSNMWVIGIQKEERHGLGMGLGVGLGRLEELRMLQNYDKSKSAI